MVTDASGKLDTVLATRGGELQPQVLLQLLARLYLASQPPAEAIAAGRWSWTADQVLLEGHAPAEWSEGLIARGHRVECQPSFDAQFGQAQVIVSEGDHLAAASDPRSETWAVAPG
jgi:gamma-glutamyltranspeptidase/glutathione hydrolase